MMTQEEIQDALKLAERIEYQLKGADYVANYDDIQELAEGMLAMKAILAEVVQQWDEDGHDPDSELFSRALDLVRE